MLEIKSENSEFAAKIIVVGVGCGVNNAVNILPVIKWVIPNSTELIKIAGMTFIVVRSLVWIKPR